MAADQSTAQFAAIGDEIDRELLVQLATLAELEWNAIELRTIEGKPICELRAAELRAAAASLRDLDMTVCCLDSNIGAWGRSVSTPQAIDIDELERLEVCASALGCRRIRVMSWQNTDLAEQAWRDESLARMRALVQRAEQLDLVLLHENCAGWGGRSPAATRQLMEAVDSPNLAVLLDIGNCIAYGQDPVAFTEKVAAHTVHVHVKDAVREGDGVRFVQPGSGHARVADCLRILDAHGYSGAISLEPHLHTAPHLGVAPASAGHSVNDFLACARALQDLTRTVWRPRW